MTFRGASVGFVALCISAGLLLRQQEPREPQPRFDPANCPHLFRDCRDAEARNLAEADTRTLDPPVLISGLPPNPLVDGLPPPPGEANPWPGTVGWHAPAPRYPKPSSSDAPPLPPKPAPPERRVIASSRIVGSRCTVQGQANGAPFTFSVDTGDPIAADFSATHVKNLSLNPATLHYEEIWPGTRYGKIATTTLHEIRIGDVTWNDVQVRIYSNWRYAFGDDEKPLLGLAALQSRGIHLEIDGDMCRLTAPPLIEARQ